MQLVVYDGSFEGFLTSVFDIYDYRYNHVEFSREENFQENMFGTAHMITTDENKTKRVWQGLQQKLSRKAMSDIYKTFLSEKKNIENILLDYIRYVFANKNSIEYDMTNDAVLTVI